MSVDFEKLPEKESVHIFKNSKLITLKRKKILYNQHEKVEGVYLLKSGILKVFRTDLNGNSQILFFYRPGEFFGYQPIFGNLMHPIGVAAIEDCQILVIDKNIFIEMAQSSTTLCNELLKGYSSEYTVFINRMNIIVTNVGYIVVISEFVIGCNIFIYLGKFKNCCYTFQPACANGISCTGDRKYAGFF